MEWISVKERLPEEGLRVLTLEFNKHSLFNEYRIDYLIHFDQEDPPYIWACRLVDECAKVTHWMPLPEPPKE